MSPLVRELDTTDEKNAPLRQQAKTIAKIIETRMEGRKNKKSSKQANDLENEENDNDGGYVKLLHKVQQKINAKRGERVKARKQQVKTFIFYINKNILLIK